MTRRNKREEDQSCWFASLESGRWDLPRCFLIHAWPPPAIQHVISQIETALKNNFKVGVDRDFGTDDSIREQALTAIQDASLGICILDDPHTNIAFESGYARALRRPCILMVGKGARVNVVDYYPDHIQQGVWNPALRDVMVKRPKD